MKDLKKIYIPSAKVRGISPETWAEIVNPRHLELLERFFDLLASGDSRLEPVLVQVIANLAAGGVLIPDDRLFQRRVTAYLNSPAMKGSFLLNYLLLSRLPVFFNDVGAVSRIRDYSTELDAWGNDPVIYFVRKQVHVNASSNNVRLIEEVLRAWVLRDPSILVNLVPSDILDRGRWESLRALGDAASKAFFSRTGESAGPMPDSVLTGYFGSAITSSTNSSGPGEETARPLQRCGCSACSTRK